MKLKKKQVSRHSQNANEHNINIYHKLTEYLPVVRIHYIGFYYILFIK